MLAIVETGGKQYKVQPGDVISVEKLDANIGETIKLGNVLLVSNENGVLVGQPAVEDANVEAEVMEHNRYEKILVFKKKQRKDYKKRYGHRQHYTKLRIKEIKAV